MGLGPIGADMMWKDVWTHSGFSLFLRQSVAIALRMTLLRRSSLVLLQKHSIVRNFTYDREQYGTALGRKCADKLWEIKQNQKTNDESGIFFEHQAYCGHGLAWLDGNLVICEVYDGTLMPPTIMKWSPDEKDKFIRWLSVQSDFSLSGSDESAVGFYTSDDWARGNQRLCRSRIESFLAGRKYP